LTLIAIILCAAGVRGIENGATKNSASVENVGEG